MDERDFAGFRELLERKFDQWGQEGLLPYISQAQVEGIVRELSKERDVFSSCELLREVDKERLLVVIEACLYEHVPYASQSVARGASEIIMEALEVLCRTNSDRRPAPP
ncbi:MAG: hypothetical protein ACP5UI_03885 [Thermoprotei archaeon]|nr:hypothetical protein [TACK group archaeon]